ncbi:LTA synthase family protein [Mesorhizobium xinjiangense]|uniref:LTA synthase family protein n=1 Tax=Mesorhizobium xinjiangense TaxID=2678685 RepID=UPI001F308BCF|nr:LTA synthase family protein [Mesorhizobium xinjiangense]
MFSFVTPKARDATRASSRIRSVLRHRSTRRTGVALLLICITVFLVEAIARSSLAGAWGFFVEPHHPALGTVIAMAVLLLLGDALCGRALMGFLILAPLTLGLAWIGAEKVRYLGDPLYPSDFLYARQIVDLLPLLIRERPLAAVLAALGVVVSVIILLRIWLVRRRLFAPLRLRDRAWRVAVAVPAILLFASMTDYHSLSWARERLYIWPIMWDQQENYDHNGFALAFALNVPMANVSAPPGYSAPAMARITDGIGPTGTANPLAAGRQRPDVILIMSESFWDPTRLPGISIEPDPIPTIRGMQSGHIFSPEFGGMTANVEFEALTGFSNAFLPYGSIPYQQYVRGEMPSLATFFKRQGYVTRAFHPFKAFFWNRGNVYESFGFDRFYSYEKLPSLKKRGKLASDAALIDEMIRHADTTSAPFFYFAVTLQSHGPYEPDRYPDSSLRIRGAPDAKTRGTIATFAQNMADADASFARLIEWAEARKRPTVIGFFGDHLPPLGKNYARTGMFKGPVAERIGPASKLLPARETPLVLWSNTGGSDTKLGTISPAFVPLYLLSKAGLEHPYYTQFLGRIHERFDVIDRHLLIEAGGDSHQAWLRNGTLDPLLDEYRLLQYDTMFGRRHALPKMFPDMQPWPVQPAS